MAAKLIKLDKKLRLVRELGKGDIPSWIVPILHREIIFESIKGKRIALSRNRLDKILKHKEQSTGCSKPSDAELLAIYQKRALDYIESLSSGLYPLTCLTIKKVHSLLFTGNADDQNVKYRNKNFAIANKIETPIDHCEVEHLMKDYDSWLRSCQQSSAGLRFSKVLEFATEAHLRLVYIHPFADGNGRTARVLLNAILRRYRLPYVALPKVRNSGSVEAAITAGFAGQKGPFYRLLERLLDKSCELILKLESQR